MDPWVQLVDLEFADDLALLSHNQNQMQANYIALSLVAIVID